MRETAAATRKSAGPVVDKVFGYKLIDGKPYAQTNIGSVCIDSRTGFASTDPIWRGLSFDERTAHHKKTKVAREFMRTAR